MPKIEKTDAPLVLLRFPERHAAPSNLNHNYGFRVWRTPWHTACSWCTVA